MLFSPGIPAGATMTFETALANHDGEALIACPKSELHTHAILGGSRSFVRERTGIDVVPLDRVLASMDEMHEWVSANRIGEAFPGAAGRMLARRAKPLRIEHPAKARSCRAPLLCLGRHPSWVAALLRWHAAVMQV